MKTEAFTESSLLVIELVDLGNKLDDLQSDLAKTVSAIVTADRQRHDTQDVRNVMIKVANAQTIHLYELKHEVMRAVEKLTDVTMKFRKEIEETWRKPGDLVESYGRKVKLVRLGNGRLGVPQQIECKRKKCRKVFDGYLVDEIGTLCDSTGAILCDLRNEDYACLEHRRRSEREA